ncbi:MAG: TAXI family TRAP transporter solute-binding subunit [Pirellulales bacterium]
MKLRAMALPRRDLVTQRLLDTRRQFRHLWFKVWSGGFLVVVAGFALTWFLLEPAPPRTIVIAAGSQDGAYYRFAEQYAVLLAQHDITLEIQMTAGSLDNYRLLASDPAVDLAIVQGGTAPEVALPSNQIEAIASLYFEPVWVFYRSDEPYHDLRRLRGARIAIGKDGSGNQSVAKILLEENGIDLSDRTRIIPVGGKEAAHQLTDGQIDAAIFVISPTAPIVRQLLQDGQLRLMSLDRSEAYPHRHPFLCSVTLERGVIDLETDQPSHDVQLIAPVANLVAAPHLHDSLVPLLLKVVSAVHAKGNTLVRAGQFPTTEFVEFPLNESARIYFESGPPFLQKYLPFWVAAGIDRSKIFLLPIVALMIPLLKLAPPLYRWRIRSRIYRWYEILREIEGELRRHAKLKVLQKHAVTLARMEQELDELDCVPLAYMEEFYNLRLHGEFVERRVKQALQDAENGHASE